MAKPSEKKAIKKWKEKKKGDNSGTHLKEVEIRKKARIVPEGPWYITCPGVVWDLGTLNYAAEKIPGIAFEKAVLFSKRLLEQ